MFLNTKLLGIKVPFHVNFEEVNLRFYVKRKINNDTKRGVVFIKEIVPKPALTFVTNTVYKENYLTLPMNHQWKAGKSWNFISVNASNKSLPINEKSETEFIAEHYGGYAKANKRKTTEYEVTHPKWKSYSVKDFHINVDFEKNYGKEFSFLKTQKPSSVMLLEGSEITVENKIIL